MIDYNLRPPCSLAEYTATLDAIRAAIKANADYPAAPGASASREAQRLWALNRPLAASGPSDEQLARAAAYEQYATHPNVVDTLADATAVVGAGKATQQHRDWLAIHAAYTADQAQATVHRRADRSGIGVEQASVEWRPDRTYRIGKSTRTAA